MSSLFSFILLISIITGLIFLEENNTLIDEISLPATTVSQTSALSNYEIPLNFALPAGYKIYVTLGTTIAAGYDIAVFGGSYTALT